MAWLLAVFGALMGAALMAEARVLGGLVAGALLGWLVMRVAQMRSRQAALERTVARLNAQLQAGVSMPQAARAPVTADTAAPIATPDTRPARAQASAADRAAQTAMPDPPASAATGAHPTAMQTVAADSAPRPASVDDARAVARGDHAPPAQPPPLPTAPRRVASASHVPHAATPASGLGATLWRWLGDGNLPVKIGVLVLFFGVAGALKLAIDNDWIRLPIELRLAGIAAAALAALGWGWANRQARPAFGLSLQGGAIGTLLLVVFAAFRLYALLPAGLALALAVAIVAAAALLAVLQNAVALATLGFTGGYLAPVLVSTGSGNHVALFSYYAVLNAAVFAIAWVRPWRALNLVGFVFTFAVGTLWGWRAYQPAHFATVEPFLLLFVLFYIAIAVLYALRGPDARRPLVDGTLVFGTPLLGFGLQAALLSDDRMALAYSALAAAALYAVLAAWLIRSTRARLLGESFAVIALGFATLAVPLALSAHWTSATWALEGAALVWLGLRQQRRLPQLAGWTLQLMAAGAWTVALWDHGWSATSDEWPLLNGHALGCLILALAAFATSRLHERAGDGRVPVWIAFLAGLAWWHVLGLRELAEHAATRDWLPGVAGFLAVTAVLAALLRRALDWPRLGWIVVWAALALLPVLLAGPLDDGVLDWPHAPLWAGTLVALLLAMRLLRPLPQRGLSWAHVALLAGAAALYGGALLRLAADTWALGDGWRWLVLGAPLMTLLWLSLRHPAIGAWPLADAFPHYRARWVLPASAALGLWWLGGLLLRGDATPLPFVPLLNPLELVQATLLVLAWRAADGGLRGAVGLAGLAFLSTTGLRAVAHWNGLEWSPDLLQHAAAQTALSVLWGLAGVTLWITGSRRQHWGLWACGATLLGVVLAKLVLVDGRAMGTLSGIVSFLAVGALLVLVGRIAPTPPRHAREATP